MSEVCKCCEDKKTPECCCNTGSCKCAESCACGDCCTDSGCC